MDSTYGSDPAEYWVKVTYDSGREELHSHLHLNEAYALKTEKEQLMATQHKSWKFDAFREHIENVDAGRDTE